MRHDLALNPEGQSAKAGVEGRRELPQLAEVAREGSFEVALLTQLSSLVLKLSLALVEIRNVLATDGWIQPITNGLVVVLNASINVGDLPLNGFGIQARSTTPLAQLVPDLGLKLSQGCGRHDVVLDGIQDGIFSPVMLQRKGGTH